MSHYAFPAGHYFSVIGNIRIGAGGQTRMALLRHRLFQNHAGIAMPLVTFNPVPSYDPVRENLLAEGLLLESSELLNMHEWLRDHEYPDADRESEDALTEFTVEETYTGELSHLPWRVLVTGAHSGEDHWDYLRPDGTRYLRTPADSMLGTTRVFDQQGRTVADLDGLGDLWRWWMTRLLPAEGPVFLISDSRFIAVELGLLNNPRVHLLHQVHTPHVSGARRWNSTLTVSHEEFMRCLDRCDTVSLLTAPQRHDVELRFGATDNLQVIANPTAPTPAPVPLPERVAGRIVMVARLEASKRIDHAIDAFANLASKNAHATLDIYGEGNERQELERYIATLGLSDRITLHGHMPEASDEFWSADLSWSTSAFEGFGLAILESRARACPVISMDVPYGPAEQIENGVDGVLVPDGDSAALAQATVDLLMDRDHIETMRVRAREGALAHGYESFLSSWAKACTSAQSRKSSRTRIDSVRFSGKKFWRSGSQVHLDGTLNVKGTGDRAGMRIRWQMWLPKSDAPVDLPLEIQVSGDDVHLAGKVHARELPFNPSDARAKSRILIEWRNSAETIDMTSRKRRSAVRTLVRRIRKKFQ